MQSKKVVLDGVGEILLERSARARHINLSVKPFRGIRVAVPRGVSFQEAFAVARAKSPWLARHLDIETDLTPSQVRSILVERLDLLAERHGFRYNRVFVRHQRTRWGSCSHKNNINLNARLVLLPEALMEYTILHELVHTRVKNHGPAFWKELARCVPDPKALDRQLNDYWTLLVSRG
jgi:predicted metal-dependent hydrolase